MELVGPVVDIVLFFWDPVSRQISYLKHLKDNVETLTREMKELKCKRDEIQEDVNDAISVGKNQKPLVENWLADVSRIEAEVNSIKSKFALRRICLKGCCTHHLSRHKLGKRVVKKLKDVENLKGKVDFDMVAVSPPRQRVLEMQTSLPQGQQSTSDQTLKEIWQCLHDEEIGIVGVYGMGGIGKSTLMKAINNMFIGTDDFNVVIWVTVSNDLNIGLIQEEIGNRLSMKFHINVNKREKLLARLKNVRYLLILDDLWDEFSLDQVGIPKPNKQNRCKIVITTRSVEVCNAMGADKQIRVKILTDEEARNLFYERCGDVVQSSEIRPIAEKVVEECSGLPLAIKTVGRAMRHKDKKELWQNALRALKGSSPEIPGMEQKVFLPLKHSYDCLENDAIKSCFLYCSLFPEDYNIEIEKLVTYWAMEEGFIENVHNLEEASNKGHNILERIKDACLLEEGSQDNVSVKMHDLLRHLAIWITSPSSSSSNGGPKFLVQAGKGLVEAPEEKMWGGMERISLMQNKIEYLQIKPNCPNLVSLFLNENVQLCTIDSNFFAHMPKLQILNLSETCIQSLPVSIQLLVNLRVLILSSCKHLVEVPSLEKLEELQLLDLSRSSLLNFPQGIANLVKLKKLDLSHCHLTAIPYNMICRLPSLEDLNLLGLKGVDQDTFSAAATITRLRCLRIRYDLNGSIANDKLQKQRIEVHDVHESNVVFTYVSDEKIRICQCENIHYGNEGFIKHAIDLRFHGCKNGLTSLSQYVGDSKSLRYLKVSGFCGVECIIDWKEVGNGALQCLEQLDLFTLPNLEKVLDGGVPPSNTRLQNLRKIELQNCPKLRCLLSSSMIEHLHQLEELRVSYCCKMKEIIEGDMLLDNLFPRLRILYLGNLSKLTSICSQRFIFISLEEIIVKRCPRLKKLPLLNSSIREIKGEIEGEGEWWKGLEWEDDHSKSLYSRKKVS